MLQNIGQLSTKQHHLLEWLWEKPGHLQLICPQTKQIFLTTHRNGNEYINSTSYREKQNKDLVSKIAKDLKMTVTEDNKMAPEVGLLKLLSDMVNSTEVTLDKLKTTRVKLNRSRVGRGPLRAEHGKLKAWQAPLRARDQDTTVANLQEVKEHCHDITASLQEINTHINSHPNVLNLVPKLKFWHKMLDKMSAAQSQVDDITISRDEKLGHCVEVYITAIDHILSMLKQTHSTMTTDDITKQNDDITIPEILRAQILNNQTEKTNTKMTTQGFSTYNDDIKSKSEELFPWDIVQVRLQPQLIHSIVVHGWPQIAGDWSTRLRQWPPSKVLIDVTEGGFHLVPRCSFYGMMTGGDLEWYVCFARAETTLMRCFNEAMKHAYFIFKCLFTTTADISQPQDNWVHTPVNNTLTMYHVKTIMFWAVEKHTIEYWQDWNLGKCILDLITDFIEALKTQNLPHYFIPENNLFEHFGEEYLTFMKEKFQVLRALPLSLPKDKKYCTELAKYIVGYCDRLLDTFIPHK